MSQDKNGVWGYVVHSISNYHVSCDCEEHELETTGEFADPKDFYSGDRVKVIVHPDGKGEIQ